MTIYPQPGAKCAKIFDFVSIPGGPIFSLLAMYPKTPFRLEQKTFPTLWTIAYRIGLSPGLSSDFWKISVFQFRGGGGHFVLITAFLPP